MFRDIQNECDVLFCTLPPPVSTGVRGKIKHVVPRTLGRRDNQFEIRTGLLPPGLNPPEPINPKYFPKERGVVEPPSAPAPEGNMAEYYCSGGGCFSGDGKVLLSSGMVKKVRNLSKGDLIYINEDETASVICLVEVPINSKALIVEIDGLILTPKHPILVNSQWVYPKSIKTPQVKFIDSVFNLILSQAHIATINGIKVVTLGHGLKCNPIVSHPYYGTERVISDLKEIDGFDNGRVVWT